MVPSPLRILLDQNIPVQITDWLRSLKPNVLVQHVREVGLSGKSDQEICLWAQQNQATVITFDEDFTDVRNQKENSISVVRLKVWPTTVENTKKAVQRLFTHVTDDELIHSLAIIDENKIRLRSFK